MEKFNINRFGQVFMRLLMVRKKTYTTFFLATTILFTLATVLSCNPFRLESFTAGEMSSMLVSGTAFCIGLMIAVQGICASFIVSDLKTKQDKIQELMLPATNLEKFVARLLGSTLFVLLIMFIAFALSDVLQQLLNMLIHKGSRASMLVSLFSDLDMFSNLPQDAKSAVWVYLLGAVSSFSVFALGGMLFRKVAWLKTSIAVFLIIVIGLSLFVASPTWSIPRPLTSLPFRAIGLFGRMYLAVWPYPFRASGSPTVSIAVCKRSITDGLIYKGITPIRHSL
ncbi:hypothetical protein [Prevotella dentasini]|uniref:hypothetical protein n=1 Tax=Prevotella dentasini TaxID=589537 RepID=UPI000684CAF2|nr:hypothetical protein [Prevotella dentasini]